MRDRPTPRRIAAPAHRELIEKRKPVDQAERGKSDRFAARRTGEEQVSGAEDLVPARDLGQGVWMIGGELDVEGRVQLRRGGRSCHLTALELLAARPVEPSALAARMVAMAAARAPRLRLPAA